MDPLLLVLTGTAVLVGCLMGLRLPAFLSLILAAFTVCLLTPASVRQGQLLKGSAVPVTLTLEGGRCFVEFTKGGIPGAGPVVAFERRSTGVRPMVETGLTVSGIGERPWLDHVPPGMPERSEAWLVSAAVWRQSEARSQAHPLEIVAEGFGATCASIGLLIILASIIGECLTASGAAERIIRWIQEQFGEDRAPQALASSAFLLGIPVFFDTVFFLLMPLGRGLAMKSGRNFLLYTLAIVAGATMAHSLVPPTPGPLFAAREFGVSIGMMMAGGTVVGVLSVTAGFAYAHWANRRWPLSVRPLDGTAHSPAHSGSPDPSHLPPLWAAFLPIALPVLLIALAETSSAWAVASTPALQWIRFLGQGQMALLLGTGLAVLLLVRRFQWRWSPLKELLGSAVSSGGVILLITAAGGAFGAALRQTDVASELARSSGASGFGLIVAAFVITALVRIAQGSATVAMLTAAGVVAPVALASDLPFHPVYLALAVGCGSKPVPWMNDSGFWIIGRMSGMSETETFRSASVMMSLMGCVGLGLVLLGAWLLPMK